MDLEGLDLDDVGLDDMGPMVETILGGATLDRLKRAQVPAGTGGAGLVGTLFARAYQAGHADEYLHLLTYIAQFAPRFDQHADLDNAANGVPLAWGTAAPKLICLPSLVLQSGAHQFVRFAASLDGIRDVVVLPHPGFLPGQPIAADVDAIGHLQARAIRRIAGDDPFVIVGYSSGGWVGHVAASLLEAAGIRPDAVVLLDTYPPCDKRVAEMRPEILRRMAVLQEQGSTAGEAWLFATAVHMGLFDGWQPRPVQAPTLLLKASEPPPGAMPAGEWQAHWPVPHAAVEVLGNHFTVMEEHAANTATAIHRWLAS